MRIKAFHSLSPPSHLAAQLAAVPYDTVDVEEAAALARGNPYSFLRISRAEIECEPGISTYDDAVYQKALDNFQAFQKEGKLIPEPGENLYVYRQSVNGHTQRGIVAGCHVEDYRDNIILKHEKTRQVKEDDRARYISTMKAHSGPIFLFYRDQKAVDQIVADTEAGVPLYDFTADDGVHHTVWRIKDTAGVTGLFAGISKCYIADGHHRAAAAARIGLDPSGTGDERKWFMGVLFPASQLNILPYNRCVEDLNGLSEKDFIAAVSKRFKCVDTQSAKPARRGFANMYLGGKWYAIELGATRTDELDVTLLQDGLLKPILGIDDPRTNSRISFIGGIRGTGELTRLVDGKKAAVAFSMHPVEIDQIMAISDAGDIMPPKSTWFEPKLRSGLFVHPFDGPSR
jgi:uncharacterized protein (DUF1015 family)